jgi:peptidoglycan/LPS O-acetylase OafA/YrhL
VSGAREETKRAAESLVVGLVAGALHLAVLSDRFTTEQGRGGLTLLVGCTFTTGVLWAMLMLRSLAADKPVGPELDDGLTSMAVTAWVLALVPPRASNFLLDGAVDDFSRAYLPVSLLVVFVMLGAQALWPRREERLVWLRLFSTLAVASALLAGFLVFVSGGADAGGVATRALGVGAVAAVAAGVQWYRVRS